MKRIGLFFGGLSNEHEISVLSALNIAKYFDNKKNKLVPIFWDKNGEFFITPDIRNLKNRKKIAIENFRKIINSAFLITHGKFGEDGILQAILESQRITYSGCHVLASALCMDKGICKTLLAGYKIPQAKYACIDFSIDPPKMVLLEIQYVRKHLRLPIFVKPANSGSSVGITKVISFSGMKNAIRKAKRHDSKIIFEEGFTDHREVEVAILGNKKLIISEPGELIVPKGFYDYDEKYKKNRTQVVIPALLDAAVARKVKQLAEKVYRICGCTGFARIDFFIKNNRVFVNEINTLPGFTDISMYPRLMENAGISYKKLISKIIELAY